MEQNSKKVFRPSLGDDRKMKVSIVIAAYNEEKYIGQALQSLENQGYKEREIIVVDDGSTDKTPNIAKENNVLLLRQKHSGPGKARNLGAKKASGQILVFLDADMKFEKDFIKELVEPITSGKAIGTFSKNELNGNVKNVWSKCWNINRGWPVEKLTPDWLPDTSMVFRAILKKEFVNVGGFSSDGEYTDDWSLSKKLNKKAQLAKGAVYYHFNPENLNEVFSQASWFATNKFMSGSFIRKIKTLAIHNLLSALAVGTYKAFKHKIWQFIVFKVVFNLAVSLRIVKLSFRNQKYK